MSKSGHDIKFATDVLNRGGLIAIPTETVYGLAANALSREAVVKIFEAKNRPSFDPLIVHVSSVEDFDLYAQEIPEVARKLAQLICPGPVSFVFKKKTNIPDLVTAGHPTVALRVPNHPLTLGLLRELDYPLAAPSANPFGYASPTSAQHVADQLGERVDYILDGGNCNVGLESTILDFSTEKPRVLRLGGLSLEFLEDQLQSKLEVKTSSSNPNAPGMLSAHYNPGKPVYVGDINKNLLKFTGKRIGILSFKTAFSGIDLEHQRVLSVSGDLSEAAQNFFRMLREFNQMDVDVVLAEWLPNEGLGRAVNDRLKRAAATES